MDDVDLWAPIALAVVVAYH